MRKGDIIGIENQTSFDNLKIGDIIVLTQQAQGKTQENMKR
jgi:hypothetical protein